jgi:phosphohistidine phosphatase
MDRTLILVRHAQSITPQSGMRDVERTLTDKGVQDASKSGKYLKDLKVIPQLIYTSHAVRALSTARLIADQMGIEENKVVVNEDLYEASIRILLKIIHEMDENLQSILITGHNPSISYLSEFLTDESVGDILPSGFCIVNFTDISWSILDKGNGRMTECKSPSDIII